MKRILSFVLTLVFIIGVLPCMGVSAAEDVMTDTERVITQLRDIGMLQGDENGEIEPAATLSRAEFVTLIARILGIEDYYAEAENDLFVDVPQNHWAKSAILACAKGGYVIGTDDGIFSPEDNVSLEQAAKIMVKVLGYEYLAQEKGGYPAGHMYAANRLEILDNITTPQTEAITMGDAAHLFFNALEVPLTEEVGYSGDSVLFSNLRERTVLAQYLKLDREEATLDAVYGVSLNGEEITEQNQIVVGGKIYEYNGADLRGLVGRTVDFFYTIDEKQTKSTVKSILPAKDMNVEIDIPLNDLVDAKKGLITYEDAAENQKEVKISSELKYVYNYELLMDYNVEDLKKIQTGSLTLVDNNNDKVYDVAFVYDYTTYIVETKTNSSIQGKKNTDVIDLKKDKRLIYVNYYDGREVAVARIKAGHILSVIQTDKILDMKINDVNVTGVYESMGDGTITVNGTEYEVAKDMYAPNVKLGSTVSVYLNAFNQVAYMDAITVTGGLQVGYLARLAENEGVFSSELRVRLLNEAGELQILTIAERMVLNDNYYTVKKDKDKILADLNYTTDKNIEPQLIQYALNADGEVCQIHLAADYLNADEDGFVMALGQDTVDKTTGEVTKQGENLRYYTSYGITRDSSVLAMTDAQKTKIFMVPTWDKIGSAKQEDFVVMSHSDVVNESIYDMKLYYTSKKNALVDYIVIHHENPRGAKYTNSYNNKAGVFLNMISVWDDGEAKPAIEYFDGKEAVTFAIADYAAESIPVMKKGDAMRVTLNWKGEVDAVELLYNKTTGEVKTTKPNTSFAMGLGYIVFEKDGYVRVSDTKPVVNDSSVLSMYLFPKAATNVIVVEDKDGTLSITKGSADDIALGTKVFYMQRGVTMVYYIVYK